MAGFTARRASLADSLAGRAAVVLAAGAGERLRPLTQLRPKPLCPVANTALLDGALVRVGAVVPAGSVAVNAHHHADQVQAHLADRPDVHLSVEPDRARGTAGGPGRARGRRGGRAGGGVQGGRWWAGALGRPGGGRGGRAGAGPGERGPPLGAPPP